MILGPRLTHSVHNPETCNLVKCNKCGLKKQQSTSGLKSAIRQDEGILDSGRDFVMAPVLSATISNHEEFGDDFLGIIDTTSKKHNTPSLIRGKQNPNSRVIPHHRQYIQLCDGRIEDISVNVLPSTDFDDQPRIFVHGLVTQITRNSRYKRRKFKHEFFLPNNVDVHRVTWCLEAQTDTSIYSSVTPGLSSGEDNDFSDSILSPPLCKQSEKFNNLSSLRDHNQLIIHAPFFKQNFYPPSRKTSSQPDLRMNVKTSHSPSSRFNLNVDEFETGYVTREATMDDHLRSIPVKSNTIKDHKTGSKKDISIADQFCVPLKMSEQPAEYNLTDSGCELTETLDPDIDPASIRVHVKGSRGQIWLTFSREIIHEQANFEDHGKYQDPQLFRVRTTSRREFKLNPEKFDIRGTTARVTSGKIVVIVPYLLSK